MRKTLSAVIFLLLWLSAFGAVAGTLTTRNLSHASVARSYLEYRPTTLAAGALPLVVVLHGGADSAAGAAGSTRASSHWRVLSDAEGFVVAYPDGVGGNWNDCGQVALSGSPSTAEDVGFLRRVAGDMSSRFNIDQSRIYVSGASNGGLMSLRLLQEASETFAGAAAFIALNALDSAGECRLPVNPSTVIYQYATADPLIQAAGGVRNQSAVATRAFWLSRLNCVGAPVIDDYFDTDPNDGSTVSAERFQTCADGSSLHIMTATGAGHTTPSILYPTGGNQNRDIEAVEEAWKFLKEENLGIDRWFVSGFE
jgi:polyhydroxybutyrate depolymerase